MISRLFSVVIWLLNTCARLSVMSISFQAFSFEYMYMATRAARIFDLDLTACFLPSLVAFVFVLCFFFLQLGVLLLFDSWMFNSRQMLFFLIMNDDACLFCSKFRSNWKELMRQGNALVVVDSQEKYQPTQKCIFVSPCRKWLTLAVFRIFQTLYDSH